MKLDPPAMAQADGADAVFDRAHRTPRSCATATCSCATSPAGACGRSRARRRTKSAPQFSADGRALQYRGGADWFIYDLVGGVTRRPRCSRPKKDPDARSPTTLAQRAAASCFSTLREIKADAEAQQAARARRSAAADPTRAPQPFFIGDKDVEVDTALVARRPLAAGGDRAEGLRRGPHRQAARTTSPNRATRNSEESARRVGRNDPAPQSLLLLDLRDARAARAAARRPARHPRRPAEGGARGKREAQARTREGRRTRAGKADARSQSLSSKDDKPEARPVRIVSNAEDGGGGGIEWSDDGRALAIQIRAIDNKDRWIATRRFRRAQAGQPAPPDRRGLDQLELQRVRLAAGQPHAVVPVRGERLLAALRQAARRQGAAR